MKKLIVNVPSKKYPIYMADNFTGLTEAFEKHVSSFGKACIVVDSNVNKLYTGAVEKELKKVFNSVSVCVFNAGEENKNLDTIQDFYKCFFENRLDRKSVVVALGGGVTGDMAGFAAATYMRGISFVQIPTTLLSQVDSSVGGKTGVDFTNVKNLIGTFYQPEFVYINVETLKSLPRKEFISGMGEVVKYGFLHDSRFLDFIEDNKDKINNLDKEVLKELVFWSCKIKAEIVGLDEKEQGIRETLNFGHTFGHAIETMSNFTLPHGQCVAIGMCAALYISCLKGDISEKDLEKSKKIMEGFDLPANIGDKLSFADNDFINHLLTDKKVRGGNVNLILLKGIGHAYTYANAAEDELLKGLSYIR